MADAAPKDLVGFLDYYLVQKAPFQLPDAAKEAIVRYGPWIAIVLLLLSLPLILVAFGLGAALLPFAAYSYTGFGLTAIVVLIELVLDIAALPGLFARKMSGWRLILYARLLAIAHSLLIGAVISAILGGIISLYILFQIRPLYREGTQPAAANMSH
jgi:hypothetical protein